MNKVTEKQVREWCDDNPVTILFFDKIKALLEEVLREQGAVLSIDRDELFRQKWWYQGRVDQLVNLIEITHSPANLLADEDEQ